MPNKVSLVCQLSVICQLFSYLHFYVKIVQQTQLLARLELGTVDVVGSCEKHLSLVPCTIWPFKTRF